MRNKLELLSLEESPPRPRVCPPSGAPPWTELPSDVTANILQRLGTLEILESAQLVCATWWKVCQDPAMWRVIKIKRYSLNYEEQAHCNIACRRAVDRSQGQLVDLNIVCGGDDEELLDYIANRSPHLRRLTLNFIKCGSGAAVAEAVKKLPELEDLHLLSIATLVPADIESIGTSCPSFNSFILNFSNVPKISHNDCAVAISRFMPRLQQLQLIRCEFDDTRLEAILDGCHHLQSLHLESSHFAIFLGGDLAKRCRDQVKHFVLYAPYCHDYNIYDDDSHCYHNDGGYRDYNDRGYDGGGYRDYNDDRYDGGYDEDYGYDDYGHTARSTSYWSKLVSFFTNWSLTS